MSTCNPKLKLETVVIDKAVQLKPMSDISMLTLLIQASVIIKNGNGDSSIHGYVNSEELATGLETQVKSFDEADFATLDCISNILVQGTQVVAASYDDPTRYTIVIPNSDPHEFDIEFFPMQKSVLSMNATIIPNSNKPYTKCDTRNPNNGSQRLGQIREIKGGKNLWIHEDPLHDVDSLDVSTPEGLASHAESVSYYLYEYACNKDLRPKYSDSFFHYLLAASWLKLHHRFRSWRTLSFIQQLELAMANDTVRASIETIGEPFNPEKLPTTLGAGDRTLAGFFSRNKNYLLQMATTSCRTLSVFSQPSQLDSPSGSENAIHSIRLTFDKFGKAVELALQKEKALYTKETALDFHCLLYLSFLMTGRALSKLQDSFQSGRSTVDKYKQAIKAAALPVRFLVYMLSSKAFRLHMEVWTNNGTSLSHILPDFEQKALYLVFGKDRNILPSSKQGPQSGLDSSVEVPSPDFEDSEDDDVDEISLVSLETFYRWVGTFVAHFLAKRKLEFQSVRIYNAAPETYKKPKFRILAVSSERYQVPTWDRFETVIRGSLARKNEHEVQLIIDTLKDKVVAGHGLTCEAQRGLFRLRGIIEGKTKDLVLRMHCEAVFAALLEARRAEAQSNTNTDLDFLAQCFKPLQDDMISVSKLCCPVCWELFKALDLGTNIRGCHPTVTPLALPDILPPKITERIVTRLQTILSSQLVHIVLKSPVKTTQHRRNESEAGYSATSSNDLEGSSESCLKSFEAWKMTQEN